MIPAINIDTGEFENVDEKDILFLTIRKNTTYFHSWRGTFRRIKGTAEHVIAFEPYGLSQIDRNSLARIELITRYDPLYRIAYFDNPDFPTQACLVDSKSGKIINRKLNK